MAQAPINNQAIENQIIIQTNLGGTININQNDVNAIKKIFHEYMNQLDHTQLIRLQELIFQNQRKREDYHICKILVDIGSIQHPCDLLRNAEVRFSITNLNDTPIKITSVCLNVINVQKYLIPENQYPAGPIDEYFLYARIGKEVIQYELVDKHFIVLKDKTEGFFLKIDGEEGLLYEMNFTIVYHWVGGEETSSSSTNSVIFLIAFPIKSIDNLLTHF